MTRNRYLTGGLAAVAVATALTLSAPTASHAAGEQSCGQAAVAPVYETVTRPAEYVVLEELSHQEWRWTRTVETLEHQYSTVVQPATFETDWTRRVPGPVEQRFSRTVIDQEARPAVPGTPAVTRNETVEVRPAVTTTVWVWLHQVTGDTLLKPADWGAGNGQGMGWVITETSEVIVLEPAVFEDRTVIVVPAVPAVPAVPEVSHVEHDWSTTAPGPEWTPTGETRPGAPVTESATTSGEPPAGDGWVEGATRQLTDAVLEHVWETTPPAGYSDTGMTRTVSSTETTDAASEAPPAGDGWTQVDGSGVTVVDQEAGRVLVTPEQTEQVLVSEGVPATDPCPIDPLPPTNPTTPNQPPSSVVTGPDSPAAPVAPVAAQGTHDEEGAQGAPASSTSTTVLPNTGNEATLGMAVTGLGAVIVGGLLAGLGRRRRTA